MTEMVSALASSIIHDSQEYVRANLDGTSLLTNTEVTRLVSLNDVWRSYLHTGTKSADNFIYYFCFLQHTLNLLQLGLCSFIQT
ncbi:MAG: hypothetical protein ACTSQZ_00040 [Candidatus Thorarchaeota archaeon]